MIHIHLCYYHVHLFPMLNHFGYNCKMIFSFYIFSLLEQFIKNVQGKDTNLYIYQCLIFHFYHHQGTMLPSPTTIKSNTLVIHNPTNYPKCPSHTITLDKTLAITHCITQAWGKTPTNDENPPNPIKSVSFPMVTHISTLGSNKLNNLDDNSQNPTPIIFCAFPYSC